MNGKSKHIAMNTKILHGRTTKKQADNVNKNNFSDAIEITLNLDYRCSYSLRTAAPVLKKIGKERL